MPILGRDDVVDRSLRSLLLLNQVVLVYSERGGINSTDVAEGLAWRVKDIDIPDQLTGTSIHLVEFTASEVMEGPSRIVDTLFDILELEVGPLIVYVRGIRGRSSAGRAALENLVSSARVELNQVVHFIFAMSDTDCQSLLTAYVNRTFSIEPIEIVEPSLEVSIETLKAAREDLENHHRVTISDGALSAAAVLAYRFSPSGFLPRSALKLLDACSAQARMRQKVPPSDLTKEFLADMERVRSLKEQAIEKNEFEAAASYRKEEMSIKKELGEVEARWLEEASIPFISEELTVEIASGHYDRPQSELRLAIDERIPIALDNIGKAKSNYHLLDDVPIDSLSQDLTGELSKVAAGIGKLLKDAPTPFVFAVDASWGSGKSSLLRLIEHTMRSEASTTVVNFNAWTAEDDLALESLVRSVLYKLDPNTVRRSVKRVMRHRGVLRIAKIAIAMLARLLGVDRAVDEFWSQVGADARVRNELRCEIHKMLEKWIADKRDGAKSRIVVFIDDIDRCTSSTVVALCEAIKLYLDAPGIVFILACDLETIANGVSDNSYSERGEGRLYLEKIVQVSHKLATPSRESIVRVVRGYAAEAGIGEILDSSIIDALVDGCMGNPRRIKRMMNDFVIQLRVDDWWERRPGGRAKLIRVILLQHLHSNEFARLLNGGYGNDSIGRFLHYATFRRKLSGLTKWEGRWWFEVGQLAQEFNVSIPDQLSSMDDIRSYANKLKHALPAWYEHAAQDEAFIALLEGLGGAKSRMEIVGHIRSGE